MPGSGRPGLAAGVGFVIGGASRAGLVAEQVTGLACSAWHSLAIALNRIARARPFLRMDKLAIVMSTRAASCGDGGLSWPARRKPPRSGLWHSDPGWPGGAGHDRR
jgi:hypothetical protein